MAKKAAKPKAASKPAKTDKSAAKKPASSKPSAKKPLAKKPAPASKPVKPMAKKTVASKPAPAKKKVKPVAKKTAASKPAGKPSSKTGAAKAAKPKPIVLVKRKPDSPGKTVRRREPLNSPARFLIKAEPVKPGPPPPKLTAAFIKVQKQRLLQLKDNLVDSMSGQAYDTLRARAQDSEASAFGMHQADAGSDAYDRDFALNLLSQEQDALYEVDEALKRIESGNYGICEISNRQIPSERLEAIPFARFTVDIQAQVEREHIPGGGRRPIRSLFGLMSDEDDEDGDEEGGESEKE